MKKVRGIPVVVALAVLLFGTHPASGSQLNLLPILQISGQYSDNVFYQSTNKRSDTFFIVNPGVAVDYASRSFVGSLAYQAGIQRYVDFDERDNTVHRVDASAGFNLGRGWSLDANDNLYKTTDPLAFDASGDRIQRDSFTYNRFVPGLSYQFSNHNLRVGARFDRIDINYDTLTDSHQNGFGLAGSGKLGVKSTIAFDYFEFHRYFDRQSVEFNTVDYTGRRFGGTIDRRVSPRFSTKLFMGYEKRTFEQQPANLDFHSFIFDGQLTGEYPGFASWSIGFSQRLNDLAVRGAYKVQRVTFDVRKSMYERLRIDLSAYYQHSKNDEILDSGVPEDAKYKGARIEGQYLLAKFMNVWLGYNYLDRKSHTSPLNPFTENMVNFGLTLSYGL